MNIFVAKLSSGTTSENLLELFGQYGEVTSGKVIMDRETGFSKRYGFVEMSDDNAARTAIENLNMADFDGAQIVVKEALPREQRSNDRPKSFDRPPRNSDRGGDRREGGFRRDNDRYRDKGQDAERPRFRGSDDQSNYSNRY